MATWRKCLKARKAYTLYRLPVEGMLTTKKEVDDKKPKIDDMDKNADKENKETRKKEKLALLAAKKEWLFAKHLFL